MEKIKEAWYPEDARLPDEKIHLCHVDDVSILRLDEMTVEIRSTGILRGISFWLNSRSYEWMLVKDDEGEVCLLPRKKV